MAQYKTGTVSVTNGSATVTGSGTLWSGEIAAGDLFTIVGDNAWYEVASVGSNTSITLSANYAGTTGSGKSYAISRDFTTRLALPYPQKGDIETASIIKRAFEQIDTETNIATANYSATSAPTANDDSGDGYSIGSWWVNVTSDEAYLCVDATVGAAVWTKISVDVPSEIVSLLNNQSLTLGASTIEGLTIGKGAGAVSTNTAVGASALVANTTGAANTAVGNQAGYTNATGNYNSSFGHFANKLNTGSLNSAFGALAFASSGAGQYNSAFGYTALNANTSGNANVAIGGGDGATYNGALGVNTTGSNNVAIGNGTLQANTTASGGTAVGYQAAYSNTTGSELTALGYQAGYTNATGTVLTALGYQAMYSTNGATQNVGVGHRAGYAVTTGSYNTTVGVNSLRFTTTGNYNTALGLQALFSNTTASYNTAVGYNAGFSQTTASESTFIGNRSGEAVTTGNYNTAIGSSAFRTATTGSDNVSIGAGTQQNGLVGSSNTAVGNIALQANAGSNNTAIGFASMLANTSGNYNTALGMYSLQANTTASSNTAVGYQAGYSQTLGSANTFIGHQAGYSTNYTAGISNTANTFVGWKSGYAVTTGYNNTIIGCYSGNQGGLDIRTSSGVIVLSDGDGNPVMFMKTGQTVALEGANSVGGTGINFPATQNASSNANTLDDYEEGTWTPTLSGASGSITVSSVAQYTKIGNLVMITAGISWSGSTLSGQIVIGGFPFATSNSAAGYRAAATFGYISGITFGGQLLSDIPSNSTSGPILYAVSNSSPANITLAASGAMQFTFVYQTS